MELRCIMLLMLLTSACGGRSEVNERKQTGEAIRLSVVGDDLTAEEQEESSSDELLDQGVSSDDLVADDLSEEDGLDQNDSADEDDLEGDEQRKKCQKSFDDKKIRFVNLRHTSVEKIKESEVIALKINGNQESLVIDLVAEQSDRLQGVCLFLAGNQASLTLNVGIDLQRFVFIGRGNKSRGLVSVKEGASIHSLKADLKGNQTELHLEGDGDYPCEPEQEKRGNARGYSCQ